MNRAPRIWPAGLAKAALVAAGQQLAERVVDGVAGCAATPFDPNTVWRQIKAVASPGAAPLPAEPPAPPAPPATPLPGAPAVAGQRPQLTKAQ